MAKKVARIYLRRPKDIERASSSVQVYGMDNQKVVDCYINFIICCCCIKRPLCRYMVFFAIPLIAFIILLLLRIFLDPLLPSRPDWMAVLAPLELLVNVLGLTIRFRLWDYAWIRNKTRNPVADDPEACRACTCLTILAFGLWLIGGGLGVLAFYLTDISPLQSLEGKIFLGFIFNIGLLFFALIPAILCSALSSWEGK